jgi:hypothetical protein
MWPDAADRARHRLDVFPFLPRPRPETRPSCMLIRAYMNKRCGSMTIPKLGASRSRSGLAAHGCGMVISPLRQAAASMRG